MVVTFMNNSGILLILIYWYHYISMTIYLMGST